MDPALDDTNAVGPDGGEGEPPDWEDPRPLDRALGNQLTTNKKRWMRRDIDPGQLAEELAKRLDSASHLLVDRLFDHLSNIPSSHQNDEESSSHPQNGLTLPASAIGWLSTQMYPLSNDDSNNNNNNDDPLHTQQAESALWMGASMRDRLSLLKYLLPRATHLRITCDEWPPPNKSTNSSASPSVSFVGRDLDLSHLSVHSGVTMETSFNVSPPNIQSFLLFYNQIQNKPRVDMRVFPGLSVLYLDRIAPEWIVNLLTLSDKLKLIRTERGCVFDMSRFLFGLHEPLPEAEVDPLSPPQPTELKALTYLKLNNAGLGEKSGLRGRRGTKPKDDDDALQSPPALVARPPPLSRLPNLVSLSLAHNEIRTVKTALSGLSSLSNLKLLDLSYNRIRNMKGANRMLGNVKTLILTGNLLENVQGLEKLYSLERLYLNHNKFEDLADVAGLGNLPELAALFLKGNPFKEKDPIRYRVLVLNLFKSARFSNLLPGATYRHLLQILPVLDGTIASKRELVGLKDLTYRRALPPPPEAVVSVEGTGVSTTPTTTTTTTTTVQTPIVVTEQQFKVTPTVRPRRVTRKARKGKAVVRDDAPSSTSKVVTTAAASVKQQKPLSLPKIEFSTQDVITSLAASQERAKKSANNTGTPKSVKIGKITLESSSNGQSVLSFGSLSTVNPSDDGSVQDVLAETDKLLEQAEAAIEEANGFQEDTVTLLDNYSSASLVPGIKVTLEDLTSANKSPVQGKPIRTSKKLSGNAPLTTGSPTRSKLEKGQTKSNRLLPDDETPRRATMSRAADSEMTVNTSFNPFDDDDDGVAGETIPGSPSKSVSFSPTRPRKDDVTDYLPIAKVAFPDAVWNDESSQPSSLGTDPLSGIQFLSQDKYLEAEEGSLYDGPDGYKKLSVMVNLELYFRLFVFSSKDLDVDTSLDLEDDTLTKMAIQAAPRIQLRPVDRKVSELAIKATLGSAKTLGIRETFKKVWQDEVIACGKSAARRVSPHKKLRRGFHGDPVFSDGTISFAAESRKVILSTSDTAIYLMPDYDAVSVKLIERSSTRKFPSPMPQEALFQDGVWPHALARLPIESLKRITIGFSFQRLTLHFAPSSEVERAVLGNALTFILATSNRMTTVKLLQHFQELTKETGELRVRSDHHDVVIDNDDKQVLDALSVAVAPCSIDVVLHYQVLQQRWKSGDRGTVRRVCVLTDSHIFLLDEDYVGDGSESYGSGSRTLGEVRYNLVDSAELDGIVEVQAAIEDPKEITIVIKAQSRLQRNHNWRLLCRDSDGAERLVEDARKAMSSTARTDDL